MNNAQLSKFDSDAIHGALYRLRRVQRTCTASLSGETLLFVHGADRPSADEWAAVVATVRTAIGAGCRSILVVLEDVDVRATDRALVFDAMKGSGTKVAFCADGVVAAVMGMMLSCRHDGIAAKRFRADYASLRDACDHVGASDPLDIIAAVNAFRRGHAA